MQAHRQRHFREAIGDGLEFRKFRRRDTGMHQASYTRLAPLVCYGIEFCREAVEIEVNVSIDELH